MQQALRSDPLGPWWAVERVNDVETAKTGVKSCELWLLLFGDHTTTLCWLRSKTETVEVADPFKALQECLEELEIGSAIKSKGGDSSGACLPRGREGTVPGLGERPAGAMVWVPRILTLHPQVYCW